MSKPTLGIEPQSAWREKRIKAIAEAIGRRRKAGQPYPDAWVSEIAEHIAWLYEHEEEDDEQAQD